MAMLSLKQMSSDPVRLPFHRSMLLLFYILGQCLFLFTYLCSHSHTSVHTQPSLITPSPPPLTLTHLCSHAAISDHTQPISAHSQPSPLILSRFTSHPARLLTPSPVLLAQDTGRPVLSLPGPPQCPQT